MVPSPKVATYDLQPEMSAPELTDKAVAAIRSGRFDLIVLNYANPDMVGHTGSLAAAVKAVETVDAGLGRIAEAIREAGGALVVTADHGNCEMMRDPVTGGPHTAHTTNVVPVFLAAKERRQVIIVTHNPNLAVVCDAEQIVHCRLDIHDGYRLRYESGALENPKFNQLSLDVLEGTAQAFEARRKRAFFLPAKVSLCRIRSRRTFSRLLSEIK